MKIYDVFLFGYELDLLEIRLNLLDPYVDYFVFSESKWSFSGIDKGLNYENNKDRFPNLGKNSKITDAGKVKYGAAPLGPIFSDATLNVLTSKNNANIEVRFNNVFPVSLSSLDFNQQANDIDN